MGSSEREREFGGIALSRTPGWVVRDLWQSGKISDGDYCGELSRRANEASDRQEAVRYAERLAVSLWEKHWKDDAPQWKPLSGDLIGILTQIDNMTAGLRRIKPSEAEGREAE